MKLSRLIAVGSAAGAAAVLGISTAAMATAGHPAAPHATAAPAIAPDSLRALGAKVGLRIGDVASPSRLANPKVAAITAGQASVLTPENEMKWQVVEPTQGQFDWSGADQVVAFAEAHGDLVRGHTLMWHSQLPTWLTDGVANGTISSSTTGDSQLKTLLHQHITTEVSRYKGKIWQWDVANELFANAWDTAQPDGLNANDFWIQHLGSGIVADAFRWAHAADPNALLCYNDFNIAGEDGPGPNGTNPGGTKFQNVYNFVKNLKAQGVPIGCVGEQGHLDTQYGFSGTRMQSDLQQYASLGVKVAITEADVRTFVNNSTDQVPTNGLEAFAQPYEFGQMLKACLAVRQCISFTIWGMDDAESWVPGVFAGEGYSDIYDVNLQPKDAYYELQQDLKLAAGAPDRPDTNS
jgi:endo-1,4-beta-xylanase